ncbi:MAG: RNA polymerase sigma factor [Acidobacteriia bacterium]|nr:RNA polymerase sigma factor [Terriglobia bacterium]
MADSPIDDQELLRQLDRGKETAFEVFYERFQGPIYRFALHMSGNPATAEEITQEVFMILIDNPKGYDPGKGTLASYLFGAARNLTRRSLESTRLDLPLMEDLLEDGDQAPCCDCDLLAELSRSELLDSLRRSVITLPELYREVVVLCDFEEMSYPEAARLLGCSEGTVASRLHRARTMLKAKLQSTLKGQGCAK